MDGKLLEDLAVKIGVFISNLSSDHFAPLVGVEIKKLSPRDYSLAAWNYCMEYLYHKTCQLNTYEELDVLLAKFPDEAK